MGLINLVQRGTSRKDKSGWSILYAHPEEHWKGRNNPRDYVAKKGMIPCVGCVGIVDAKLDRSYGGIPSY